MTDGQRRGAADALTTIWLARHGEAHNPRNMLYGRLPRVGLSAEGARQARALGELLAPRPLHAIYSSPMLRARKTAAVMGTFHPSLHVRVTRDLHEVLTGWDGHPLSDLDAIGWDFYHHRRTPRDERMEDIRDRMRRWVRHVLERYPGQEVAGVSHGDPILILLGDLRQQPMELARIRPAPYIPTASLFRLTFDRRGTLHDAEMLVPHAQVAA